MVTKKFLIHYFIISLFLFVSFKVSAEQGYGAIATAHPLATQAGKEILHKGGNAFDAAVAISAALAVVEPYGSGIGGGGFWLLHQAENARQVMIDGREMAPSLAHETIYLDKEGSPIPGKSINGPTAAGIPGTIAALDHIARKYGTLPLAELLEPAIRYAEEGFEVTERYQMLVGFRKKVMQEHSATADIFLKNNETPNKGERIVQTDLANTLKLVAHQGGSAFYNGQFAKKMVQQVNRDGGFWKVEDLVNYKVKERKPIVTQYRDMKITSAAPPSSGGIVLAQALGILEHFNLQKMDPVTFKHHVVEAMRRAYRDRAAYLGDADFVDVPVQRLLDKNYLHGLKVTIDSNKASSSAEMGQFDLQQRGKNTTHFSVMDKMGNRVAATLSINLPFGSAYVIPGTGILLNDEMDDFSTKPNAPNSYGLVGDHANLVEPGKRPLSSMSPTFIENENKIAVLGTPGGSRIISMVLLGILDFEKRKLPKSWVSIPRYHHQYLPDQIQYEKNGLTANEIQGLQAMGHLLKEKNRQYGNMQAVMYYKPTKTMLAASDPRGEGEAITFLY